MLDSIQARTLKEGHTYRHYKGGLYRIIKFAYATKVKALNSPSDVDDDVKTVVYRSLDPAASLGPDVWWARPYRMFIENVLIDGVEQPRFTEIDTKTHPTPGNTTEYLNV